MSKLTLDVFDIFALLKQEAGKAVAEIVESDPGQVRRFERWKEMTLNHVATVHRPPGLIRKNQVQIVGGAGNPPFF
jgi:hypothetical protein